MCVILYVDHDVPDVTKQEFEEAVHMHSDGFGIAWFDSKGRVKFKKKLHISKQDKTWRPPKPYVMHFRMATLGGVHTKLCHPFTITKDSPLSRRGTANAVLFHNGHVSDYNTLLKGFVQPQGRMSDSRGLAMAAALFGERTLFSDPWVTGGQKYIVMEKGFQVRQYGNWPKSDDGIQRSNTWHIEPSQWRSLWNRGWAAQSWDYTDDNDLAHVPHKEEWSEADYVMCDACPMGNIQDCAFACAHRKTPVGVPLCAVDGCYNGVNPGYVACYQHNTFEHPLTCSHNGCNNYISGGSFIFCAEHRPVHIPSSQVKVTVKPAQLQKEPSPCIECGTPTLYHDALCITCWWKHKFDKFDNVGKDEEDYLCRSTTT